LNVSYDAAALNLGITRGLCNFLANFDYDDLPKEVVDQARRGILDWLGCALAGSRHETVGKLLLVLNEVSGRQSATVIGHGMRLGPLEASLANAQMGHVLDYDDTHMGGVILHASSPILSALFALAETRPVISGRTLVTAYVAGFEAGVRTGQGAPDHHAGGWHLTGTLGSIAAGAASGRLLGLCPEQLVNAIGVSATQAAGMQQNRGTMSKSFHAGKAAANGALAALLAMRGFQSSDESLEGKQGFIRIYSRAAKPDAILDQLGSRWEIVRNGFKPYACGVVLHPTIDAMVQIGSRVSDKSLIERIELRVHPLAISLTGVQEPESALKSKFSINHTAAVALLDGAAGIPQFSEARVQDPLVIEMRRRVFASADESLRKGEVKATIIFRPGNRLELHIEHASGTAENPISDEALEAKFVANAVPIIGMNNARRAADLVWRMEEVDNVAHLISLCSCVRDGTA
jgi:2-methylcitrate dehydratase PrpD